MYFTVDGGDDEEVSAKKEHYYKLARLYQTYQLWVEEPLLHDSCLYLPSLPQQYQSDKLLTVFQQQTVSRNTLLRETFIFSPSNTYNHV